MSAWKLPLVAAAIAVPTTVAFVSAGPAVGVAVGALVAVAIVVFAVRQRPRETIAPAGVDPSAWRVLVVVADPLEDPSVVNRVADAIGDDEETRVMVLAPARIGFLDRWASDVEPARHGAQQRLVISVAALAAAGIDAEARVGDEDVVQAVEDHLGSFPASEVILVGAGGAEDKALAAAADELRARLQVPFRWVATDPGAR
ncbi:MAG TPA: hypothetical protein VJU14_01635 [Solirubrobacterales bacterium]|nr:hypothetical protein [Solirubrobacterales bacterium]